MTDLALPGHLVNDLAEKRIKADFKPFFNYANSICVNKLRREFETFLVRWISSIEQAAYDGLKKEFFSGIPPQRATLPKGGKNPKYLSRVGVSLAHEMANLFQTHKKEPLPSKLISLGG